MEVFEIITYALILWVCIGFTPLLIKDLLRSELMSSMKGKILFYIIFFHFNFPLALLFLYALYSVADVDAAEFLVSTYLGVSTFAFVKIFRKTDIYRKLRPIQDERILSGYRFPQMKGIDYEDALIYPRFKLMYLDKPVLDSFIFETTDYKEVLDIIGDRQIGIGSTIEYEGVEYVVKHIDIEILDTVIDFSNGDSGTRIGEKIPFHIEIWLLV